MTRDLGTYFVRVVLQDGRGWIQEWSTGGRYTSGTDAWSPLTATRIPPVWDSEDDLISAIVYAYAEGNYSCDCNKKLFLHYANAPADKEPESECGDTLQIATLVMIRPDGSEVDLTSWLRNAPQMAH